MCSINFQRFREWIPVSTEELAIKLLWSVLVVAVTFALVKFVHLLLRRLIEKEGRKNKDTEPLPGNLLITIGVLFRTLITYSAIFAAAVTILEIFKVKLVSTTDLKNIGLIALKLIVIIVTARLAARLGRTVIAQLFARNELKRGLIENRRAHTLEKLLSSGVTYLVFFLAGLTILQIFNVNTSAILASAGILGLAVGFGAKNLVRDIIGGFFIIFEDQFAVGDYVEAGGAVGWVEEIGLRTSKIRKWTGQLHIIPNGEITSVTNYNRGHMAAVAVLGIAYEEDIDQAIQVLQKECHQAHQEIPAIVKAPVVQGVVALDDFGVKIRVVAMVTPGEHWAVERELLRRFKNALDREAIEMAYNKAFFACQEEPAIKDGNLENQLGEKARSY